MMAPWEPLPGREDSLEVSFPTGGVIHAISQALSLGGVQNILYAASETLSGFRYLRPNWLQHFQHVCGVNLIHRL
jgi:hypothetical protein